MASQLFNGVSFLLEIAPPLNIRLAHAEDRLFLDALYRESRPDLLALPLEPSAIEQMIAMQRMSRSAGVKQTYPGAQDWLLCWHQEAVGRLLLDMGRDDIRVVDIAVQSAWRNHGFASSALAALQGHATRSNKTISLAVQCDNLVARRVYQRAGFLLRSSDALFDQLIWQPTTL